MENQDNEERQAAHPSGASVPQSKMGFFTNLAFFIAWASLVGAAFSFVASMAAMIAVGNGTTADPLLIGLMNLSYTDALGVSAAFGVSAEISRKLTM